MAVGTGGPSVNRVRRFHDSLLETLRSTERDDNVGETNLPAPPSHRLSVDFLQDQFGFHSTLHNSTNSSAVRADSLEESSRV